MPPVWHPLSALYLPDPPLLAPAGILRRLLAGGRRVELIYAGDRMFPSIRHGERVIVTGPGAGSLSPRPGDVVLCEIQGVPDLLRLRAAGRFGARAGEEDAAWSVAGDGDPSPAQPLEAQALMGVVVSDGRRLPGLPAALIRLALDLREAAAGASDRDSSGDEPAGSVLQKYDEQAVHYDLEGDLGAAPGLLQLVKKHVRPGGRILVAGSGTGRECFSLESCGWDVTGLDFSPAMTAAARARAERRGSRANFVQADIRSHEEPAGTLSAVLFTYDAYSFLPRRAARVDCLRRLRRWLEPGGRLVLSARLTGGLRANALLALQALCRPGGEWGDSHTRWLHPDARIGRAYVHLFTPGALEGEIAEAGLLAGEKSGGHWIAAPAGLL